MAMDCRSKMKRQASGCGWKHHTMLHVKKNSNNSNPPNYPAATSEETGPSTTRGAGETGTSAVTGAGMLVGVVLQVLAGRMFV